MNANEKGGLHFVIIILTKSQLKCSSQTDSSFMNTHFPLITFVFRITDTYFIRTNLYFTRIGLIIISCWWVGFLTTIDNYSETKNLKSIFCCSSKRGCQCFWCYKWTLQKYCTWWKYIYCWKILFQLCLKESQCHMCPFSKKCNFCSLCCLLEKNVCLTCPGKIFRLCIRNFESITR